MESAALTEFSETVESIYDAALEPAQWPRAVYNIAKLHQCEKALLFTAQLAPAQGGFAFPIGISERVMLDWGTRYIQHDVWAQAAQRKEFSAGTIIFDTDFCPDEELLASVFYRDFLVPQDIRRVCSGMIFDYRDGAAPGTFCSVFSPHARPAFGAWNRQVHGLIINHLSKSLGTMLRLRDAELRLASTLGALNRLPGGIVLLGQRGQVLFANEPAMRLLSREDGLGLHAGRLVGDGAGWLHATRATDQALLQREIQRVIAADPMQVEHFSRGLAVQRPSGLRPLVVQLAPLSERSQLAHVEGQAHAITFLTDPEANIPLDVGLLSSLYHFTSAEIRLAERLVQGDTVAEIAQRNGVSVNTVKTQLQCVFQKTGTSRQSDLVKLLLSVTARP